MLNVRTSSYGCTREVGRAREKRKNTMRSGDKNKFSFLSALQRECRETAHGMLLTSVFHTSVLLLVMNFVITLSK